MRTFSTGVFLAAFLLFILFDLFAFKGCMRACFRKSQKRRNVFSIIYRAFSIIVLVLLLLFYFDYHRHPADPVKFKRMMDFNGLFIAQLLPKIVIAVVRIMLDLYSGVTQLFIKKIPKRKTKSQGASRKISRGDFIQRAGIIIAAIPFIGVIHGIGWGRFNFTLHRKKVFLKHLPDSFEGFTIVQLSDAHLGSFPNQKERIAHVFKQVNDLKPDLIVFTGDMVNNFSNEISGWVPVWQKLHAPYGKFSVLGNHDYGGYSDWPSPQAKQRNLQETIRQEKEMGFQVLMNQSVRIEKNKQFLYLAGVENWGRKPFPQRGRLDLALKGIPDDATTILLSHDPNHWDDKVLRKVPVDLTLSGHTHGFQFGFEWGPVRFSPVQLRYKRWAGLYHEQEQYLYVNRGLGYLAFPGRVGIWPEITLIELTGKTEIS